MTGGCRITGGKLIEKTITLNIECSGCSEPDLRAFCLIVLCSPRAVSIAMTDVSPRCPENNAVRSQSKWSGRFVRSVLSLFDWIGNVLTGIYSVAQEVPRSECQDVPSQVPKQVEKNVCKDIPRQV